MANNPTVWGVHMGAHVGDRPIDGGYVGIGWDKMGDLTQIAPDREAFKAALAVAYPDKKAGAIPVDAGSMFKFLHEIKAGDIVVYPSKADRMVNIGRFKGSAEYVANDPDDYLTHQHVEWLGHFPRNEFSQSALNEIGSFLTMFRIKRHKTEFLGKIDPSIKTSLPSIAADPYEAEDTTDDDTATVAASLQAEANTSDFVIKRLMTELTGHQFEDFMAHLLECMGYTARVTPKSSDGGVDVIAHMDALGLQPPIIKVQCKRITSPIGIAEVNQLLGTLGEGEFGLFVCLGSYTRPAIELERNRSKLRLIDGEQFVEMVLENYGKLSPRYRTLLPLKQIYVPDLPKV
ncbi:restriction endonuclease [Pseudorhodobacter wandonensis]|uniref:restriction endonuclease n=1 Tax=Pseudorhodobacter wandonensis TaxID=1120568 RepID=UPI00067BB157|nr:restriction endonuclease [Pseudorhodobacter wandonensis]